LRTKLTLSATPLGLASLRSKSNPDDLASLNFAADAAGALQLNTVTLTFAGSAPSAASGFYFTGANSGSPTTCATCIVQIYDAANGTSYFANASTSASGLLTFNLNGYTVSANTSKSFNLRINSTGGTPAGTNGVSQTLSVTISSAANVGWTDALDNAATANLGVPASTIPVTINSVSYAQGT
jgi:hypothetical protein